MDLRRLPSSKQIIIPWYITEESCLNLISPIYYQSRTRSFLARLFFVFQYSILHAAFSSAPLTCAARITFHFPSTVPMLFFATTGERQIENFGGVGKMAKNFLSEGFQNEFLKQHQLG